MNEVNNGKTVKTQYTMDELLKQLFLKEMQGEGENYEPNKPDQVDSMTAAEKPLLNIYDYFVFCYISICSEEVIFQNIVEYFRQYGDAVHIRIIIFLELWITHNFTVVKYDENVQEKLLDMLIELAQPDMVKSKWTKMQLENLMHRIEDILCNHRHEHDHNHNNNPRKTSLRDRTSSNSDNTNNNTNSSNSFFNGTDETNLSHQFIRHIPMDCLLDWHVDFVFSLMAKNEVLVLAQQVCLYEQFLLMQLDNRTVINHKKYPNRFIAPQIAFFDSVSNFACALVYFSSKYDKKSSPLKNKIEVIQKLVDLTFALKLYNNFSSSYSIYLSLQSVRFTDQGICDYLDVISARKLKKLDASFASQQNLALLQNNSPLPAVPYIGICFSQIARLNEIYKDTKNTFHALRLEEQTIILKNLDQFKHFKYDFELQPRIYQYLQTLPKVDSAKLAASGFKPN